MKGETGQEKKLREGRSMRSIAPVPAPTPWDGSHPPRCNCSPSHLLVSLAAAPCLKGCVALVNSGVKDTLKLIYAKLFSFLWSHP